MAGGGAGELDLSQLLSLLDRNGDGRVSPQEFVHAIPVPTPSRTPEAAEADEASDDASEETGESTSAGAGSVLDAAATATSTATRAAFATQAVDASASFARLALDQYRDTSAGYTATSDGSSVDVSA